MHATFHKQMTLKIQGDSKNSEHQIRRDEHWCSLVSEKLPTCKRLNMEEIKDKK